jgi:hypothetical protein
MEIIAVNVLTFIMPIPALLEESGLFLTFKVCYKVNPWTVARPD